MPVPTSQPATWTGVIFLDFDVAWLDPVHFAQHIAPPTLSGRLIGGPLGDHRALLAEDLTERIAAGYWALRLAGVPSARTLVANALNRHGLQTFTRKKTTRGSAYEVAERVKRYDAVLAKQSHDLDRAREGLVANWQNLAGYAPPMSTPGS